MSVNIQAHGDLIINFNPQADEIIEDCLAKIATFLT